MVLGIAYKLFQMMASGNVFDDDSSDRLSYRITVGILIVSSILIGTKQLVGDPITCWIPAHFTGNHEHYTNSYCWVRNTYYLPWENHIPKEHEDDQRYMITYYQWIPLILMIQALFFYMPRLLWVGLNKRVGMDVNLVMSNAVSLQNSQKYDEYSSILQNMSYHMHRSVCPRRACVCVCVCVCLCVCVFATDILIERFYFCLNIYIYIYIIYIHTHTHTHTRVPLKRGEAGPSPATRVVLLSWTAL